MPVRDTAWHRARPLLKKVNPLKYLYLFRHADTLPAAAGQADHDRSLSEAGQEECVRIGHFLEEEKLRPQRVLCSTAVRTRTTLGLVAKAAEQTFTTEFLPALYLASPSEIIHQLNNVPHEIDSVMVVGHNPGLQQCCMMLASSGDAEGMHLIGKQFPPASLALLRLDIPDWHMLNPHTQGELLGLVLPSRQPT